MQCEKKCTRCGETKPLDEYHRNKGEKDGRVSHCRKCEQERYRRWQEKNRDKRMECQRRYQEENPDKVREYQRRYREENRDILNQGTKIRHAQRMRASTLLASKKGTPYSPEEDALLLANNGMTDYQKAIELGRTYDACVQRLSLLRRREAANV